MKKLIEDWKENSKNREEASFLFIRSLKNRDAYLVDKKL